MTGNQAKTSLSWQHFIWRAMTVLMFFYVCADVSVCEYFEGNQSLGIVSYRQVVKLDPPSERHNQDSLAPFTTHNEGLTTLLDDTDDFCCSVHAMVTGSRIIISLILLTERHYKSIYSVRQKNSDWHLPPFYRPPRIA